MKVRSYVHTWDAQHNGDIESVSIEVTKQDIRDLATALDLTDMRRDMLDILKRILLKDSPPSRCGNQARWNDRVVTCVLPEGHDDVSHSDGQGTTWKIVEG